MTGSREKCSERICETVGAEPGDTNGVALGDRPFSPGQFFLLKPGSTWHPGDGHLGASASVPWNERSFSPGRRELREASPRLRFDE